MRTIACVLVALAVAVLVTAEKAVDAITSEKRENLYTVQQENDQVYTASWAVEITEGGKKMADAIARRHGFINLGNIGGLSDVFLYELKGWEKYRVRTDSPYTAKSNTLSLEPCIGFVEQQVVRPRVAKSYIVPADPLFLSQWSLLNSGQYGNEYIGNDLNVERAWLQGLSGCNVTVVVVDDGLDFSHRDLWYNYVHEVSYDFVEEDNDPSNNFPWHGTSCGGIIGAVQDDFTCGVGIAYNSNLGGLALLGATTDMNEERSLTFQNSIVDIYSNSWGPFDSGYIVEGPGYLTKLALETGVNEGRDGRGSIFVWANGNGGEADDCAADGYAASIYTISVGAIGVDGRPSSFDEQCSAKLTVTYVTDPRGNSAVTTTALDGECTSSFGGTSAATPLASGILALALEANPSLTWRDVQYLIVHTSNPLLNESDGLIFNGAGLAVSELFGFGVMDAEALVTRARHWIIVPPQLEQNIIPMKNFGKATFDVPFTTTIQYSGFIHCLEHVIITMTVEVANISLSSSGNRGDIGIELTSPYGTISTLLSHRSRDLGFGGYYEWPFMSVMFWGEDPTGQWYLTVSSKSHITDVEVRDVKFQFYGVSTIPEAVANIPEECHADCVRGCAKEGSDFCDACINLRNAYTLECIEVCPPGYSERNGYCYNPELPVKECNSTLKIKEDGSCVDSGFTGCCTDENCEVVVTTSPITCFCDAVCYVFGDCCMDIVSIGCHLDNSTQISTPLPYIDLWATANVETYTVPPTDDGVSQPIHVEFPFGSQLKSTVYIGTNGYFTFEEYRGFTPFIFDDNTNRSLNLVAPYFTDIDISNGIGRINYEIHTDTTSKLLLSKIDSLINEHAETNFQGKWMLVATWEDVPQYGGNYNITNTFQGLLATDYSRSFAVFTYLCGDLEFSSKAQIGFVSEDGLYANHEAVFRGNPKAIACLNYPTSPWVNVVYDIALPAFNECEVDNGGCEHICTDTFSSFECTCRDGYVLNADGHTCSDFDECSSSSHDCEDICENTVGSYICACDQGYALDNNGRTCSISCGGRLTDNTGSFHTPHWPQPYPSLDFRCEWVIDIENVTDAVIEMIFDETYGIHGRDPCLTDYLQVLDGLEEDSTSLGKYCFTNAPEPIVTSSQTATVIFQASTHQYLRSRVGASISYSTLFFVNECNIDNGGCAHGCMDTPTSYTCYCNNGYMLDTDQMGCIDVNECSIGEHDCEDVCTNTVGSYSCSCRDGYALDDNGRTCSISCGGRLTDITGTFHTPDWPQPYPSLDFRCEWVIDIDNVTDTVIEIAFDEKYGIHGRDPCLTDYLQVLDGLEEDSTSLGKYCFTNAPQPIMTSSQTATVIFQASTHQHLRSRVGASVSYAGRRVVDECKINNGGCAQFCTNTFLSYQCSCNTGYTIAQDGHNCHDIDECSTSGHGCEQICINDAGSYSCECGDGYSLDSNGKTCSISCGGTLSELSGDFQTPGWPDGYPQEDFTCEWAINVAIQGHIQLEVNNTAYGINGRPPCQDDHIEFFDGLDIGSRSLGRFCKLSVPEPITTSSGRALVIFEGKRNSNRPPSRKGVRVTYEVVQSM